MSQQPRPNGWRNDGTRQQRGYGKLHMRLRRELLAREPMCCRCGEPANVADHRKPKCEGGETVATNYQAMCEPCHRRKTASEGARARWRKARERTAPPV